MPFIHEPAIPVFMESQTVERHYQLPPIVLPANSNKQKFTISISGFFDRVNYALWILKHFKKTLMRYAIEKNF